MKTLHDDGGTHFVTYDGKERTGRIGKFYGVRMYSQRYYVLTAPKWIPYRLWMWLAGFFVVAEGYDPTQESQSNPETSTNSTGLGVDGSSDVS